jgi:Ribbon-helix-helix domain
MDSDDKMLSEMKLRKSTVFLGLGHLVQLRKISRRTLIPVSALVRKAIAEFLEREKKKKSKA